MGLLLGCFTALVLVAFVNGPNQLLRVCDLHKPAIEENTFAHGTPH